MEKLRNIPTGLKSVTHQVKKENKMKFTIKQLRVTSTTLLGAVEN